MTIRKIKTLQFGLKMLFALLVLEYAFHIIHIHIHVHIISFDSNLLRDSTRMNICTVCVSLLYDNCAISTQF